MIYCAELPLRILSPCYYLSIEAMNIISSFAEEDDLIVMDWEEHIAETSNSEIFCDLIGKARYIILN